MAKKPRKPNKEYTLIPCTRKHDYRILACDPGTRNFGIACIGVKNGKPDVIANALLTHPISELTASFGAERSLFRKELGQWFELYEPDLIIAERFQTRGGSSMGKTIEIVSMMNALLGVITRKPIKYIPAAQWKVPFNRRWGDKEFLKGMYGDCMTTAHVLDATLIGIYGLEYAMQRKLDYKPHRIIEMVETSSRMELRRPRK